MVYSINRYNNEDLSPLVDETQTDYHKAMNSILLRRNIVTMKEDIIPSGLMLPPNHGSSLPPYYGLMTLESARGIKQLVITNGEAKEE